jgi:O-antigen/teichoic acid export membrane protein
LQNIIINNPFIKNIATIAMGTTLAQGITIVISPALTRLFSPDDFGVQSVFLSISMILTILFTLQYEMAIVLPKSEEKASVLKIACIKISFIFLIAALVVSCLLALFGMISFSGKSASFVVVALSVVNAWLIAIERIANYSAIREKRFRIVSFAVTAGSISASFSI